MFNKLLSKNQLKYVFTDKRSTIQNGGSLASIFKAVLPYAKDFAKKLIPSLGVATASTLVLHGINKSLNKNKKRGGNIKIDLSHSDVKKINNILGKLSNMKLTNYKSINQRTGSDIFTSLLILLIASAILSLISGKGCCKKDNFFEKINNKSVYPISNFKINEILKNNKNYIGTFSKNNVPKLKNNESTIVNLAN